MQEASQTRPHLLTDFGERTRSHLRHKSDSQPVSLFTQSVSNGTPAVSGIFEPIGGMAPSSRRLARPTNTELGRSPGQTIRASVGFTSPNCGNALHIRCQCCAAHGQGGKT